MNMMFAVVHYIHMWQDPLTWQVVVPLFVLYISFVSYLSGPVGLYIGHRLLIALYYYRIAVMFLFALIWMVINSGERKTIIDIVLTVLWFLTAFTYFFGWYVHRRTHKFFSTRWVGYDDGDLAFAAKLRARGLPVITYNISEYFASINLERQHKQEFAAAKQESATKKD
ncbi:putative integral membrane protein [Brugia pahangi]